MENTCSNDCAHRRTFWKLEIDSFAKFPKRGAKGADRESKLVKKFVKRIYCKNCGQLLRTIVKWDKQQR